MEYVKVSPYYVNRKYKIDKDGTIINARTNKVLRPILHKKGHFIVYLYSSSHPFGKAYILSRLIAFTYLSNPYFKERVRHKNKNLIDNSLDNLEFY